MMQDIEINGVLGSSLDVYMVNRPDIPTASREKTTTKVAGKDGVLIEYGDYTPTEFEIEFNYIDRKNKFHERWDTIKKWLSQKNCLLSFTDDHEWMYKISDIEIGDMARPSERVGVFKVKINTVDGLKYSRTGQRELGISSVLTNPYLECKPIYKIKGEGMCTLTVNGKAVKANVGQNLTIDTELMLAYRLDGTLNNTAITGEYEDLYLKEGKNTITATSGFDVKIVPNWRCL